MEKWIVTNDTAIEYGEGICPIVDARGTVTSKSVYSNMEVALEQAEALARKHRGQSFSVVRLVGETTSVMTPNLTTQHKDVL